MELALQYSTVLHFDHLGSPPLHAQIWLPFAPKLFGSWRTCLRPDQHFTPQVQQQRGPQDLHGVAALRWIIIGHVTPMPIEVRCLDQAIDQDFFSNDITFTALLWGFCHGGSATRAAANAWPCCMGCFGGGASVSGSLSLSCGVIERRISKTGRKRLCRLPLFCCLTALQGMLPAAPHPYTRAASWLGPGGSFYCLGTIAGLAVCS
mmetsp:Transcript_74545/g.118540  ORF Transcript_74545/g.118540 Transcript_74545/m.118540 type:complete len:206 (+) Transcript_74545:118-735(+)